MLAALAQVRKATADRPQGPARVAPNYVFVGEASDHASPASRASRAARAPPCASRGRRQTLPLRTTRARRRQGRADRRARHRPVRPRVADGRPARAGGADVWDVEHDGYGDAESGHGTFIAGLILQVAPAADVYVVKVLDSHGLGDDPPSPRRWSSCRRTSTSSTSRSAATPTTTPARWRSRARCRAMRKQRSVVVAAAGNNGSPRPFWPAAFKQVLAVGAVEEKDGHWCARVVQQLRLVGRRRRARREPAVDVRAREDEGRPGPTPAPTDPTIAFDGWAAWDGTSFASPITAAMLARDDVAQRPRDGRGRQGPPARDLDPPAPQPDFPLAVLRRRTAPRSSSRGSRSATPRKSTCSRTTPARRPSSTKRPSSSACTESPASPGRSTVTVAVARREQLALQPALARAGGDDLELDPDPRRLERELARTARPADQCTRLLVGGRHASARRARRPPCAIRRRCGRPRRAAAGRDRGG